MESNIQTPMLVDQHTDATYPLNEDEPISIGRRESNTIVLADDLKASRDHARIFWQAGDFVVEDLDSGNGTFVNDERLSKPTPLDHNDILKVGNTELRVLLPWDVMQTVMEEEDDLQNQETWIASPNETPTFMGDAPKDNESPTMPSKTHTTKNAITPATNKPLSSKLNNNTIPILLIVAGIVIVLVLIVLILLLVFL